MPDTKSTALVVRCSPAELAEWKAFAKRHGKTMSAAVRELLAAWMALNAKGEKR